jgi:hypothetical protein
MRRDGLESTDPKRTTEMPERTTANLPAAVILMRSKRIEVPVDAPALPDAGSKASFSNR